MMTTAATDTLSLIAFTLPSTPYSVQVARFYIRAALTYHDLGDYAADAEMVASELVTNAIKHAHTSKFDLELMHLPGSEAIAVVVTDWSPHPPIMRDVSEGVVHGRGLHIVEALSALWGWIPRGPGKSVFAILSREG